MHRVALYWHTLRHLHASQVVDRAWRKLYRPMPSSSPPGAVRAPSGAWMTPAARDRSMDGPLTFDLLGERRTVQAGGWDDVAASRLWRYNLHYFDDLNAARASERGDWHREALDDWVKSNSPGRGTGWEPYPTSLRVVNWVKWHLAGNALEPAWLQSLATQARAVEGRLEYHLGGNHLFANAKALVFAGALFTGAEADRWMAKGLGILRREIPRQILADGGQYERSPMYHALALEDVLDLVNLSRAFSAAIPDGSQRDVETWPATATGMLEWLCAMCHPDGEIAFFNDAALGIAPSPARLVAYARALGIEADGRSFPRALRLEPSGYVRLQDEACVLLADVAAIGPDELPGHAHADTLSFELSLFGQRVFVNAGTSTYEHGPVREHERGTRAHNTVTIDEADSSEVWAAFRVARRAHPCDVRLAESSGVVELSAAHDGYRRLPGRPMPHRTWRLHRRRLEVVDAVQGRFRSAVARFHLQPGLRPEPGDNGRIGTLSLPDGRRVSWKAAGAAVRIEDSHHSPRFGMRQATHCIAIDLGADGRSAFELSW